MKVTEFVANRMEKKVALYFKMNNVLHRLRYRERAGARLNRQSWVKLLLRRTLDQIEGVF